MKSSLECQGHLDSFPGHGYQAQLDTTSPHTLSKHSHTQPPTHNHQLLGTTHKTGTVLSSRMRTKGHRLRGRVRVSSVTISVACQAAYCPQGPWFPLASFTSTATTPGPKGSIRTRESCPHCWLRLAQALGPLLISLPTLCHFLPVSLGCIYFFLNSDFIYFHISSFFIEI